ncbi:S-adenosyl-L-methionine-dependent methyltransferase [Aspergillus filifer]
MPPKPGRLACLLRPVGMIWMSICLHWKALIQAVRREGLSGIARIQQIRDIASARLLGDNASGFIAFENTTVVPSLVRAASGVVLELGPGPGNQLHRFDTSTIDVIYGVDPNPHFKDNINTIVNANDDLRGKYKLLVCGTEDSDILRNEGITEGSLDTVLSIQTLCTVKSPKNVMKEVWKLLKPGGKFIFWEHGCSRNRLTAIEQAILEPAWSTFVGCHLTRSVLADILGAGEWENVEDIEEPKEQLSLLPRVQGVLVKKA